MQAFEKNMAHTLSLLSSLDLKEVASLVGEIVQEASASSIVAVIMWDQDLESFTDRFVYPAMNLQLEPFLQCFCDEFEPDQNSFQEIEADKLSVAVPDELRPLFCWQLRNKEDLCACVLVSLGAKQKPQAVFEILERYPVGTALSQAWEVKELKNENERLRRSYDQLEEKTTLLEEQTRKLIHDLTARDSIRTRQMERENLVYSVSSAVRSFVDIQKVLETAVERIGTTFGVSRCLLLRPLDDENRGLDLYEYTREPTPIKDLFSSALGITFTKRALEETSPRDFSESEFDHQNIYDAAFLRSLNIKSGLLVPLVLRERVLGTLFLHDCHRLRPWSIEDITLFGSLADQISVAIENAELHLERERQAVTDGLTGIGNRRSFNEGFAREFERALRYKQPLSLILVDLDFLKLINDNFGHQVGDEAVKEIGRILRQSCRAVDIAARFGGDEFCLLLPNTSVTMAEQLAERLSKLIHQVHLDGPGHISASFGVASYPIHGEDADMLFRRADEALYQAKQAGRNTVRVANAISDQVNSEVKLGAIGLKTKEKGSEQGQTAIRENQKKIAQ
jgi:diguanylate cyclase (GGDEF)-like protein